MADNRSPSPSATSQQTEQGIPRSKGVLTSVDVDITPLLTHPDRQRSRKLLESCLREINYLMTPPTIPIDANQPQDWQKQPQQQQPQQQQQQQPQQYQRDRKPPQSGNVSISNFNEEITYVGVDNEPPTQDEELPRKLPRKVTLATQSDTQPHNITNKDEVSWDFSPPPPDTDNKPTTILERPPQQRHSAKSVFDKKSHDQPRTFQNIHTLRSHLSPVRSLIACNSASTLSDETCFISAGDDSTIKFWRVSRLGSPTKKKGNFDILPQITFRGHTGMVTCLAESLGYIWSGGSDGGIRGWVVPPASRDAYGSSGTEHPRTRPCDKEVNV